MDVRRLISMIMVLSLFIQCNNIIHAENESISISTIEDLEAIRNNLNGNYHLTNDIDLSEMEWIPIATSQEECFEGILDGRGYKIKNLTITSSNNENVGFFGCIQNAVIENLGLENINISLNSDTEMQNINIGSVCAKNYDGSIIDCYSTGQISVIANNSQYGVSAGGICSYNSGMITNCYNTADISAKVTTDSSGTPQIITGGICANNALSISNCFNMGDVSAYVDSVTSPNLQIFMDIYSGGICGMASRYEKISNCYNTGKVSSYAEEGSNAYYAYSGGICGYTKIGILSDCYNNGSVAAKSPRYKPSIGGISGLVDRVSINNCYNTGDLSTNNNGRIGSCFGNVYGSENTINACYWRTEASQTIEDVEVQTKTGVGEGTDLTTGLTTSQMQSEDSFSAFDFENAWNIEPSINSGYPYLKNMPCFIEPVDVQILSTHIEDMSDGKNRLVIEFTDAIDEDILCYVKYSDKTGALQSVKIYSCNIRNNILEVEYEKASDEGSIVDLMLWTDYIKPYTHLYRSL